MGAAGDLSAHVVSRLAYGSRGGASADPGDVDAWIEAQLAPAALPDADCDARVAKLATVQMRTVELATRFPRPSTEETSIDPPEAAPDGVATFLSPVDGALVAATARVRILSDLQAEHVLRAVYSARQLQEVMTDFWCGYFNLCWAPGPIQTLLPAHVRTVIRPNALGSFPALLRAVAQSPATLHTLGTQDEGFARALLDRYTLGGTAAPEVVREVARCFKGWTVEAEWGAGVFRFVDATHDRGPKQVFGESIAAGGGRKDGDTVLSLLLSQPATAKHVARRLVRHIVSDEPPKELVAEVAAEFDKSAGNIPAMLRIIFRSAAFRDPAVHRTRVKSPLALVATSLRLVEAETDAGPGLQAWFWRMGGPPFSCESSAGYADTPAQWLQPSQLIERIRFAMALAQGGIPGTTWTPRFDKMNGALAAAGTVSPSTRRAVTGAKPANVPRAVGLLLASPEHQKR